MPSDCLILCHPIFSLPSIFPSIRVFFNESALHIRWPASASILSMNKCVVLVAQSCLTLCDPMDCRPPRLLCPWDFPARILEWVAISFSRGSCQPSDGTWVSCTAGRFFTNWATREAPIFRVNFLSDGLVWSPCCPRHSQESFPASQFKNINSSALSLLYGPTLTSIHDY